MTDIYKYSERINFKSTLNNSIETLIELHKCHLYNIPFENLDIKNKVDIVLDIDRIYDKIINKRRGGFCYELNGLFSKLLYNAGFKLFYVSCNVYSEERGKYGADFDHMGIIIEDKERWLADVGFGESFIEPLKLIFDIPQKQYGVDYRFRKLNDNEIVLERSYDSEKFSKMYKFNLKPRRIEEYTGMCKYHQSSPDSHFTKGRLCSIATTEGRISLTDKLLIVTENGIRKEFPVTDEKDFNSKLKEYFNLTI